MIDTPMFGDPVSGWYLKFAWLPTWTYNRGWCWLQFVERRHIQKHYYLIGGSDFWWQYKGRP